MTVIQMSQQTSRLSLDQASYPDNWQQPETIEEESLDTDEESLDPIEFPDIFTPVPSEQPAIIGDENGNNDD